MNDSATQLVQLIREIVREELKDKDSTALFIVRQKNSNETYNISIYPDLDTVFYNIPNASKYDFDIGDMGVLYKLNNKPNNSFIINKFNYYNSLTNNKTADFSFVVENIYSEQNKQFSFQPNGFYASNSENIARQVCLCKIVFKNTTKKDINIKLDCIFDTEIVSNAGPRGTVGELNKELEPVWNSDGSTSVIKWETTKRASIKIDYKIPVGESFIMCKYCGYDGETYKGTLKFKVILEKN